MGFFTGFFSGFALTTTAVYLSMQVHRSNRLEQRNAIREQVHIINHLASSTGAYDRRLAPKDAESQANLEQRLSRPSQPTMQDHLKHRWNQEVHKLARKASESRWEDAWDVAVEGWKNVVKLVKRE